MRTDVKIKYADYAALPEGKPRYQLIGGELILSPSPTSRHQRVIRNLATVLHAWVDAKRLGEILFAPLDVILSDEDVVQPDIVFIAQARSAIIAPEGIRGMPDLCVEALSPSNRSLDLNTKRDLYARHGLVEYWIVDPDANTVQVFHLQQQPETPVRNLTETETLESAQFPGLTISLAALFAK